MPIYTKKTVRTLLENTNDNMPYTATLLELTAQKLKDMELAGKTDGIAYEVADNIVERLWIDEAAAQEWVDFMDTADGKYHMPIIKKYSVEIKDNT